MTDPAVAVDPVRLFSPPRTSRRTIVPGLRTVWAVVLGVLMVLPASAQGSTVRLTRDGRILMRNTTRYARYAGNERDGLHDVQAIHRDAIARRWPALANVPIEHTWGGVMAVTRNGGALFAEVGDDAYAVGTSDVSPVTRGVIAGRLMAELATGHPSELLEMQLGLERATRVPPDPLLRWVANRRLAKLARAEAPEL